MAIHRQLNGTAVKALREAKGLSVRGLAAAAYVAPSTISRCESGQREASREMQVAIAAALGVPIDAITFHATKTPTHA